MKLTHAFPVAIIAFFSMITDIHGQSSSSWTTLYNGKDLQGWDTYLGPDLDSNGEKLTDVPVGLNNDPRKVFTVVSDNGEKVIRISGEGWGGISTTRAFKNFHLQLKFKWGKAKWGEKRDQKRDSGLLYHCVGPHGADYGAWMRSQEFQIEEGNTGDYWGVAGGVQDIPAVKLPDGNYRFDASAQVTTFSATAAAGRHCMKYPDAEKPSGEWNVVDLYCFGDTSVHVVNGKTVMVLYHSAQEDGGVRKVLEEGKIQIQSEGAEVFYKAIRIQQISSLAGVL